MMPVCVERKSGTPRFEGLDGMDGWKLGVELG